MACHQYLEMIWLSCSLTRCRRRNVGEQILPRRNPCPGSEGSPGQARGPRPLGCHRSWKKSTTSYLISLRWRLLVMVLHRGRLLLPFLQLSMIRHLRSQRNQWVGPRQHHTQSDQKAHKDPRTQAQSSTMTKISQPLRAASYQQVVMTRTPPNFNDMGHRLVVTSRADATQEMHRHRHP